MKLKVENFGKIKSACIDLNGYSIFVGDNNSGKTYLMQLIYGVTEALKSAHNLDCPLFEEPPFRLLPENVGILQDSVNRWLEKNKNTIVKNTFNSEIDIGSLSLEISPNDFANISVVLKIFSLSELENSKKEVVYSAEIDKTKSSYFCLEYDRIIYVFDNVLDQTTSVLRTFFLGILFSGVLYNHQLKSLFIPASRAGFNLVYRDLLAAMAKPNEYNLGSLKHQTPESKKMGLTKPVFDYLLFMQTYKPDADHYKENQAIIDFIEKHVIKGKIVRNGDEIRYVSENGVDLPLYLTSSMVNELTPIVHLLSSVDRFGRLYYDEIETSQHPTTQIQLARLMNRLVNSGINLIVSTHSDTMAALISNFVLMSFVENGISKAQELGYEAYDLLKKDCVHAYQFEKNEDGSTIVKELEKFINLGLGYDFSLFNRTNDLIYNDYLAIAGKNATIK